MGGAHWCIHRCYWRLSPPKRDWVIEQDFNFATADYGGHFDYRAGGARDVAKFVAEAFYWLCGMAMPKLVGGQAWPVCGPVGWNPVSKDGPWFAPNPDGSCIQHRAAGFPPPATSEHSHPADNFHWNGANPGNTVGIAEVLAELASLKSQLAALTAKL